MTGTRRWAPPLVLLLSLLAMVEGVYGHGTSPMRTLVVVCFLAIAPGLALVGLMRLLDPWLEAALVPAVSLSIDAIVGGGLSFAGLWSPYAAIVILVVLSVGGALWQDLLRRELRPL